MSDDKKSNRVDLGGSGDNGFEQPIIEDDYEFSEPERSAAGKMVYVFMFLIIIALLGASYMIYKDKEQLRKNLATVKNDMKTLKQEKEKDSKRYGDLHIEVEDPEKGLPDDKKTGPAGVEIYVNGELQSNAKKDKSGVIKNSSGNYRIKDHKINQDLIFEFKKPGYYPVKLEIGACNWKKRGKAYFYENRNIRLAKDENGMMAIEAAKKEKEKEEKARKGNKKKRRR